MPRSPTPEFAPELAAVRLAYRTRRYLLRNPDVLGFGVGYRFRDGTRTEEPALVVYVRQGGKSRDPGTAPRHRRIPRRVHVPGRGGNRWLPVDLVEAGVGELCATVTAAITTSNCDVPKQFGTVGWIAKQPDGKRVFCSCYHVFLPEHFFPAKKVQSFMEGSASTQHVTCPSTNFGGNEKVKIGRVLRGVRSPTEDLAIAEPLSGVEISAFVATVGKMEAPRLISSQKNAPGKGESVRVAVGHGPAPKGNILEFPVSFTVEYPDDKKYTLHNLISTDAKVNRGDSGSLLLGKDQRPLGMLVCRDPMSGRSFFMPIAAVMAHGLTPF